MGWCTAQWKMLLFCARTVVRESRKFELARLKKKKERNYYGHLVTFWFGLSQCFLASLGMLLVMKTLEDEW